MKVQVNGYGISNSEGSEFFMLIPLSMNVMCPKRLNKRLKD